MARFEDDLDELERVVERLEKGDLSLDESVDLFERGVHLSRACKTVLTRAESRIQALVDPEDEDGPVRVEDIAMAVAEEEDDEDQELRDEREEDEE
jgi:exodeoxyribonuclease VII small subunit